MSDGIDTASLSRLLRPMSKQISMELVRALADLRADPETQARYEYLAERRTEGALNQTEESELASLVRANSVASVLKSEARERLGSG